MQRVNGHAIFDMRSGSMTSGLEVCMGLNFRARPGPARSSVVMMSAMHYANFTRLYVLLLSVCLDVMYRPTVYQKRTNFETI